MPEPILLPNGVTVVGNPFPRPCARCRTATVWPVAISRRETTEYEGRTYAVEFPNWVVPRCTTCGELHIDNYADDQINLAFRAQVSLLTPEQIQANRAALGLSRQELAQRLGISEDLVRRWEENGTLQSRVQDNLLRLYFALPQVRSALDGEPNPSLGTCVVS